MCCWGMLTGTVRPPLFENASLFYGNDVFCNLVWLHYGANSVFRERIPRGIDNIRQCFLEESGVDELVCFHDERYAAYTHVARAFGFEVPFKPVHLFTFLLERLDAHKDRIRPLGVKAVYQRSCSNRLVPETHGLVDEIFRRPGVEGARREYERENALCCGRPVSRGVRAVFHY